MTKATSAAEKLIVFDWGDVIEYHGAYSCYSLRALSYILKHMGLPCDQTAVREFIDLLYANGILTKGKDADLAAMVKAIYLHYNRPCYEGMVTDFKEIYNKAFMDMPYVLSAVDTAKARAKEGYARLGILSDLAKWDIPRLDRQVQLSQFDYKWFSFETGTTKKQEKAYINVERESGIKPCNILYFDNNANNVVAAQKRGWQAYCVTCEQATRMQALINCFVGVCLDYGILDR